MAPSAAVSTVNIFGILLFAGDLLQPTGILTVLANGNEGPRFTVEPPDLVEFSNSTGAKIECGARGHPRPVITWLLSDGSLVTNVPGLRQVLDEGTLDFPPFWAESYRQDVHAMVYRCIASNSVGTVVSRDVRVKAVITQSFDIYVYDVYAIKGNAAVMKCHIPTFLQDYITVESWIRDGAFTIQSGTTNEDEKYVILPTGELYLRSVVSEDSMTSFRCKAKHRLTGESKISITAGRLFVSDPEGNVPPRIVAYRPFIWAFEGETAILPCVAHGQPVPHVTWSILSEGNLKPIPQDERLTIKKEALFIHNLRASDSGHYVCTASNSVGNEKVENSLSVSAPLKVSVTPPVLVMDVGKTARIRCEVSGFPLKTVMWLKDGHPLSTEAAAFSQEDVTLAIDSVSPSHMGMYQCIAKNERFSVHDSAELRLGDSPPSIESAFREQEVQPNSPFSLRCSAKGNPPPEFSWTLDGTAVTRFQTEIMADGYVLSWLNISKAKPEDGGVYACKATNKAGSNQHLARIKVYGSLVARTRPAVVVVSGDKVWLNCPVYGHPITSHTWEKGDEILPTNIRQMVFDNGTLRLDNVQKGRDNGKYICTARNKEGEAAKGEVDLSILVPPKIAPFAFQDELVREGSRARLQCIVSEGDLPITFTWLKDGQPLTSSSEVTIRELDEFSSILTITTISTSHNGNYTCMASNAAAATRHTAKLSVNVPPHWLIKPQDATTLKGKDVILDCQADGFPQPRIQWMKAKGNNPNDRREPVTSNHLTRLLSNGSLLITRVNEDSEGYYFCVASNGIGDGLSRAIYLDVNGPAKFDVKRRNQSAHIGKEALLSCEAKGDLPITFSWNINSRVIDIHRESRFKIRSKENITKDSAVSELLITSVNRSDSTTFTCVGTNAYGSDETNIFLIVQEAPDPPAITKALAIGNRSIEVIWKMLYEGNSPVKKLVLQYKLQEDEWREKSTKITLTSPDGSTVVRELLPARTYNLRMFAVNEIGKSNFSEITTVTTEEEAPSGPPLHIEVESTDKQSLRITWQPPERHLWNGIIRGYYVNYKAHDSPDPYNSVSLEIPEDYTEDLIYHLTDLRMYTQYKIFIQAYNTKGKGPNSEEITVMTSEDVPSQPPQNIRCSSLSTHTIYIIWEPPVSETINGILRGYKVLYKPAEEWYDAAFQTKTSEVPKLTLSELEVNTNYSIQVLAFTKVGDGTRSQPIYCKTHEDVPSAPGDIKVLPSSLDSVLVSWKPPSKPNGAVVKYNVYVRSIDDDEEIGPETHYSKDAAPRGGATDASIHSSQEDLVYEISGLNKNQRYEFWVTAISSIGEGPRSRVISQYTAGPTVAAKSASFDDIIKTPWKRDLTMPCRAVGTPSPEKKWLLSGKPIEHHDRLRIGADGTLLIKKVQMEDGGNYTCNIQNLYGKDEVNYLVVVLVPPSPPKLGVYSKTMSSLQLKWQSGMSGGDSIRGYILHYKRDTGKWEKRELPPEIDSFTLENLACGAPYEIYMEAFNNIGIGAPCDIITITTEGAAIEAPDKEQLIREGATFLSLHLEAWPSSGCPIQSFTTEYRRADQTTWILAADNVKPSQKRIVIPGLAPGTWYHVRMTAHSTGEPTTAEYVSSTIPKAGGTVSPAQGSDHTEEKIIWMSLDPWILICAIAVFIIILIILITICVCMKRRNERNKKPLGVSKPMHTSVESFVHLQGNDRGSTRVYSSLARSSVRKEFDPSPYATATLPGCNSDSKMIGGGRYSGPAVSYGGGNASDPYWVDSAGRPMSEVIGPQSPMSNSWGVYSNNSASTRVLSPVMNSTGGNQPNDIQSRPLPAVPNHPHIQTPKNRVPQETAFMSIYPNDSRESQAPQERRHVSSFGKPLTKQ